MLARQTRDIDISVQGAFETMSSFMTPSLSIYNESKGERGRKREEEKIESQKDISHSHPLSLESLQIDKEEEDEGLIIFEEEGDASLPSWMRGVPEELRPSRAEVSLFIFEFFFVLFFCFICLSSLSFSSHSQPFLFLLHSLSLSPPFFLSPLTPSLSLSLSLSLFSLSPYTLFSLLSLPHPLLPTGSTTQRTPSKGRNGT